MKKYIKQILATLAIILIVLGIFLYITFSPKNNTVIEKIGYPTMDSSFVTPNITWVKYIDKNDEVSFEYPSDWKIFPGTNNNLYIYPPTESYIITDGGVVNTISINLENYTISKNLGLAVFGEEYKKYIGQNIRKIDIGNGDPDYVEGKYFSNNKVLKISTSLLCGPVEKDMCQKTNHRSYMLYIFEHVLDSIEFLQ